MNRDPFDTLRSRNPAPPESLPEAPMAVASKIAAGRPSLRRGLAIATAAAAVVLVAGGGWLIWSRVAPDQSVPVTIGPTPTSTTGAAPTTTMPSSIDVVSEAVVYFLTPDHLGHPSLVPVARDLRGLNVSPIPDPGPLAVELLLAGPGAWDAAPLPEPIAAAQAGLSTAVPENTRLLGLQIADGIATVNLSAEFAGAPAEAVGQVVFTLTRLDGVAAVRFAIDGVPYSAVAGMMTLVPSASPPADALLEDPATRLTFEGLMPLAMIETPPLGGTLPVPGAIAGVANPYGWRVGLSLADVEGTVLWQTEVSASCGTPWQACRGEYDWSIFSAAVPAGLVDYGQWATLRTSVFSGDDPPQPYAFREHLVWLEPVAPSTDEPDSPVTTTLLPAEEERPELVVYFLKDGALIPVARDLRVLDVSPLPDLGPLALEFLLWGPGAWDAGPLPDPVAVAEAQLTTAIPEGTGLRGLTIEDGLATVDLSAQFAAASPQAIAQVVYTLTGPYLEADEVRFFIEGTPQVVGSLTSGLFTPYLEPADTGIGMPSVGRGFLGMYQSDVMIEHPALGGTVRAGEAVALLSRLDDAEVILTLTAADGTLLWTALATPSDPAYLPLEVLDAAGGHAVWATLLAEATASDGSVLNATEIPVWLEPEVPFTDEPDIPEATTTTFGLGEIRPFPEGLLTGCATETARDVAAFEAALAEGHLDLQDLCALVGVPDGEVGSGLFIPVYDLDDGSRLYLGYTGPTGDSLLYANVVSPDGTVRHLRDQ